MTSRSPASVSRFRGFLESIARLSPSAAAPLLTAFARGEPVVCPAVSSELASDDVWAAHEERASIIADYGLLESRKEADDAHRAVNAAAITERRAALAEGWLDHGFEGRAGELAADLAVSVDDARAELRAMRAAKSANVPTIQQRAEGQPEMGGEPIGRPMSKAEQVAEGWRKAFAKAGHHMDNRMPQKDGRPEE